MNILVASKDEQVDRFVYAASSSTYGDHVDLPKIEDKIGNPLSPYAVTKAVNEQYASVFARVYGFKSIGLRYFNIFEKDKILMALMLQLYPNGFHQLLIMRKFS